MCIYCLVNVLEPGKRVSQQNQGVDVLGVFREYRHGARFRFGVLASRETQTSRAQLSVDIIWQQIGRANELAIRVGEVASLLLAFTYQTRLPNNCPAR